MTGEDDPGRRAPLADLADEVRERKHAADAGADATDDDAFEEVDVPDLDAEELWTTLLAGGDEPLAFSERVAGDADRDVCVIPKRTCERCPHFASPPAVGCTHEGTEIRRLVGLDRHEVADCPVVLDEDVLETE